MQQPTSVSNSVFQTEKNQFTSSNQKLTNILNKCNQQSINQIRKNQNHNPFLQNNSNQKYTSSYIDTQLKKEHYNQQSDKYTKPFDKQNQQNMIKELFDDIKNKIQQIDPFSYVQNLNYLKTLIEYEQNVIDFKINHKINHQQNILTQKTNTHQSNNYSSAKNLKIIQTVKNNDNHLDYLLSKNDIIKSNIERSNNNQLMDIQKSQISIVSGLPNKHTNNQQQDQQVFLQQMYTKQKDQLKRSMAGARYDYSYGDRTYKKMANAGEGQYNHNNPNKIYRVGALKNLSDVLI